MGVVVGTGLQVSFVESLNDIIDPVVTYLNNSPAGRDLFEVDHIIVPNAGVRAWLMQQIAYRVGATPGKTDGIAAQVNIKYLGALDGFLGRGFADSDPWEVGPLAVTVLSVLGSVTDENILKNVERLGGGLKAARAIADKFDQYHARRPSMILEWMQQCPNLAPELADDFRDGQYVAQPLAPADRWQYDLWQLVYAAVGQDPWAAQVQQLLQQPELLDELTLPPRLLIAGVQSLSARHIRMLQVLARRVDISVYMVHPSPALAQKWTGPVNGNVPQQIIAPSAPKRIEFDDSIDPLVGMWLRGAHDAQKLLESQGVTAVPVAAPTSVTPTNLLSTLQQSVRTGSIPKFTFEETDRSVQMHRAHNLGRQIEILHEALVHAFNDVPQLEPHDVVIMCADIEAAAPLLQATFGRTVKSKNGDYTLPLVVADRGLRFVDDGASLLANILTAARGRFSIADVMAVATSSLVLKKVSAGADDVEAWNRIIERTRIRWGASQDQRSRMGVNIYEDAHTWRAGLQRALTGALLPDSLLQSNFGDVVPMPDLEAADIDTVAALAHIVSVLSVLEEKAKGDGQCTVVQWADAVEEALEALGVDSRGELDNAREVIQTMRGYVNTAAGAGVDSATCSFNDFADLLGELIAGTPGRQPLRTGAITATSMVPLRSVPFKVVCLVGFDEGTMRAGDAEGDDLVSRQDFVGDSNPRIDQRRSILDAVLAAEHQVIITCNGRSIKDNQEVPLITPLSEFLDWCDRCGVPKKDKDGNHQKIEYQHPRHFGAAKNFIADAIVPGIVWSHDEVGLAALGNTVTATDARVKAEEVSKELEKKKKKSESEFVSISVSDLRYFISNPLRAFVRDTLGIRTWKDEESDEPAEIPLAVEKSEASALRKSLVTAMRQKVSPGSWAQLQHKIGSLPFGKYGDELVQDVTDRVNEANTFAAAWGIDLTTAITKQISLTFKTCEISGSVRFFQAEQNRIAVYEYDADQDGPMSRERVALDLLLLTASGESAGEAVLVFYEKDKKETVAHFVVIDPDYDKHAALKKLESLAQCYVDASRTPYPKYGKTADKMVNGKEQEDVAAFITAVSRLTLAEEKLIYGPLAKFDEVFTKPVKAFFKRYFDACPAQDDERARELSTKVDKKTGKNVLEQEKAPNDSAIKSKKYLYV